MPPTHRPGAVSRWVAPTLRSLTGARAWYKLLSSPVDLDVQPAVGDELLDRRLVFPFMINAFRRVGSDGAVGSDGSDAASLIRSSDAPSKVILIDRARDLRRIDRASRARLPETGDPSGSWKFIMHGHAIGMLRLGIAGLLAALVCGRAAGDDRPGQKKNDDRPYQPAGQGNQPLPAAARPQSGGLVSLGARGVRQGEGREQADLSLGRL